MSHLTNPSYRDNDYEGYVAAGLPAPSISDEDIRSVEEAWNDPRTYERSKNEGSFRPTGW